MTVLTSGFNRFPLILTVTGLLIAGCSNSVAEPNWEGEWILRAMDKDSEASQLVSEGITLTIDGRDGSGFSGCNTYQFSFEMVGDDRLEIRSGIRTTKKACADDSLMELETAFIAALSSSSSFTLETTELRLESTKGNLHFSRPMP
jgi:heat shock protein HslJ